MRDCATCHYWGQTVGEICLRCPSRLAAERRQRNHAKTREAVQEVMRARGLLPPPVSDAEIVDDFLYSIEHHMRSF